MRAGYIRNIAGVHCAECVIRARIVSGRYSGYCAINLAAILAHSAEAALVVQNWRWDEALVVSNSKLAKLSTNSVLAAAFPPSKTTSGLNGQTGSHPIEVVVKGLNAP